MYRLTIGDQGQTQSVSVAETSLESPAVERCIAGQFSRMRFPAPQGGPVTVLLPLMFAAD